LIKFDQNPANHVKEITCATAVEVFKTVLASFINPQQEICLLAKEIDWDNLEKEFALLHGEVGRPSIPIRTIVGLLRLKQIYNIGDETVMGRSIDSPYSQHFCGEIYFQYKYPFDQSDFLHFRKRIGYEEMKKIFKQSIDLFGKENVRKEVKEVQVDTTVQKKNITFPTDRKFTEKVIEHCKSVKGLQRKKV
jgi:IS5 family transposase